MSFWNGKTTSSKYISAEQVAEHGTTNSVAVSAEGETCSTKTSSLMKFFTYDRPLDFTHLFWIFFFCSVLGLFVETIVSYPIDGYWKHRAGLVWGPFSPIYGFGGVVMTVVTHPLRHASWWKIFLIATVAGGVLEYAISWFWEAGFGAVAWSYEDQPFNFNGRTCLAVDLCWGLAGLLWIRFFLPLLVKPIDLIPHKLLNVLTVVALVFLCVDGALTIGAMDCWYNRLAGAEVQGPYREFFNMYFGDEFMDNRFQTITIWPELAVRS